MQSPYTLAIDAARDTIVQRARQYKWLVIGLSLSGVASVATGLLRGSAQPLLALLLLPCAVTAFHALDLRAVHRWRLVVLAAWSDGSVQLDLLARTLRQVPGLPLPTVEGMVDVLPEWPAAEVPLAARPALVQAQDLVARIAMHRLIARSVAWGLVVLAALAAWATGWPAWLAAWLAVPGGWVLWRGWLRRQMRRTRVALVQSWSGTPVAWATCAGWLARLSWQGVPASLRTEWGAA